MENRRILKENDAVHHVHLTPGLFVIQRILGHQYRLLQPFRLSLCSGLLILHRNLFGAIAETLQKFLRRVHNTVILHGILCDKTTSECTVFVVGAGRLLHNLKFITAGRIKDFFQPVMG